MADEIKIEENKNDEYQDPFEDLPPIFTNLKDVNKKLRIKNRPPPPLTDSDNTNTDSDNDQTSEIDKRGVVSPILVYNRRMWVCEDLNCHVKQGIIVQGRIS